MPLKNAERDARICLRYQEGTSLEGLSKWYGVSAQRIWQILSRAGVFVARRDGARTDRTAFLGVTISRDTKDALKREADEKGISVSALVSSKVRQAAK